MTAGSGAMVGVDMGGTSLRALVVDRKNEILAAGRIPTRPAQKPEKVIEDMASLIESVVAAANLKLRQIRAVSIGAPGAVDQVRGIVHEAPNLGWKEVPLAAELKARLRAPVLVDNDVNVGIMGEHTLGAGEGAQELVGIFVGTGIGGGIISRGELYQGSRGGAGEIGHMVMEVDGPVCGCGHRGCVEALASRTAMERDVRAAVKAGRKSLVPAIMKKRDKQRMTSSVVQAALKKDDPVMREVIERAQRYLGILVANVVNLLDPERVVIGGGIAARLGESYVGPIRQTAYDYFLRRHDANRVRIVPGSLGDNAGTFGAVVLARKRLGK